MLKSWGLRRNRTTQDLIFQHIKQERKKPLEPTPQRLFDFSQANQNAAQSGAVHVHLLPAATNVLPNPCFAAAGRYGISIHQLLRESRVADHDGIVT